MNNPLSAFHGDPQLKADLLAELAAHREADQIIKGAYGEGNGAFRGCAVGCSIHSLNRRRDLGLSLSDHAGLANAIGVTEALVGLEDTIFENLPIDDAVQWPERLMSAIEPGVDLSTVHIDLLIAIQERSLSRLDPEKSGEQCDAVRRVLDVLRDWRIGQLDESAAESAASAARSAAGVSAESAEWRWIADTLITLIERRATKQEKQP